MIHDRRFPGESTQYREARDALLEREIELRRRIEEVAALRRSLPRGGRVPDDYVFDEVSGGGATGKPTVRQTRFSELLAPGKDTLVVYSFMFAPDGARPCPSCNSILESLDGAHRHVTQRVNLAVVAKAPIARVSDWAASRGWRNLRLLSSLNNRYNRDYFGEDDKGDQWPSLNVFHRDADGIFHTYHTELLFAPREAGQDPRHVDSIWPLWNLLDLTPDGRGTDWRPSHEYG
jgi:predicted dithiol-disulfide oxidoreductase (DUF899 family)